MTDSDLILKVLEFGVLGLCAFTLLLVWRIIQNEQKREGYPRKGILHASYVFMAFSLAIALLNGFLQYYERDVSPKDDAPYVESKGLGADHATRMDFVNDLAQRVVFQHSINDGEVNFAVILPTDIEFASTPHVLLKFDGFKPGRNIYIRTNREENYSMDFDLPSDSFEAHALIPAIIDGVLVYLHKATFVNTRE